MKLNGFEPASKAHSIVTTVHLGSGSVQSLSKRCEKKPVARVRTLQRNTEHVKSQQVQEQSISVVTDFNDKRESAPPALKKNEPNPSIEALPPSSEERRKISPTIVTSSAAIKTDNVKVLLTAEVTKNEPDASANAKTSSANPPKRLSDTQLSATAKSKPAPKNKTVLPTLNRQQLRDYSQGKQVLEKHDANLKATLNRILQEEHDRRKAMARPRKVPPRPTRQKENIRNMVSKQELFESLRASLPNDRITPKPLIKASPVKPTSMSPPKLVNTKMISSSTTLRPHIAN
jgi:hypothetical protein